MPVDAAINTFIDSLSEADGTYWPESLSAALKTPLSLDLIKEVAMKSGKKNEETVLAVLSAVRYLQKTDEVSAELFLFTLKHQKAQMKDLCVTNKVQTNQPERFLPILDCLKLLSPAETDIAIIELGCSLGLIGFCLLNQDILLADPKEYFLPSQQLPEEGRNIKKYIGLEPNLPDLEWTLSCYSRPSDRTRVTKILTNFGQQNRPLILQLGALGFSGLAEVGNFAKNGIVPVILTSFMMYQLETSIQETLTDEINNYIKATNGHWINIEIHSDSSSGISKLRFFMWFDGRRVIELLDDRGLKWTWIKEGE